MKTDFGKLLTPSFWIALALSGFCLSIHWALNLPVNGCHPEVLNGDAYDYHVAADWLYNQHFRPHPTRMFGFPLLVGWVVKFDPSFSAFYKTTYVLNAISWLLTGWLLFLTGRRLFAGNKWLTLLPMILFGLNVGGILLISQPITETFFTLLITAAFYCLIKGNTSPHSWWTFAAFGAFCFSLVVRSTGMIWFPVLTIILLARIWKADARPWLKTGILFGTILSTVGLQTIQMYREYGQIRTTNIGMFTHYLYLDAYAGYAIGPDTWEDKGLQWYAERERRLEHLGIGSPVWVGVHKVRNWAALEDTMNAQVGRTLRDYPAGLAVGYVRSLLSNAANGSNIALLAERVGDPAVVRNGKILFWISRLQNLFWTAFVFIGFPWLLYRYRRKLDLSFHLIGWFSMTMLLLSAVSFAQGDRFESTVVPLLVILALQGFRLAKRD
jgi:hypothetical protein